MKKIFILLLCLIISSAFIFSVSAAPSFVIKGNGTETEGIIPPTDNYYIYHTPYTEDGGFPNADFEKGFMYWTQGQKGRSVDSVELLQEENGNKYVAFTAKNDYDGIFSIRFSDSRVKVGDTLAVMWDWRGDDPSFQIALNQIVMNEDESSGTLVRLSQDAGDVTNIHFATRDDGWNTSMSNVTTPVKEPDRGNPTIYLSYIVQIKKDITCNAHIDNLRVVIYNRETGNIFDLDRKKLYNIYELDTGDIEDQIDGSDFEDIDYDAKPELYEDKKETATNKTFMEKYLDVIIGTAAILVAAAVVSVILTIKKRKNASND